MWLDKEAVHRQAGVVVESLEETDGTRVGHGDGLVSSVTATDVT